MRSLRALLFVVLLPGCEALEPSTALSPPESAAEILPDAAAARAANVSGFAWDPESFFFALAEGQGALPPVMVAGVPTLERALVGGAAVTLLDPLTAEAMARSPSTGPGGTWEVLDVPAREAPLFVLTEPPESTAPGLRMIGPPQVPMVPDARYLPTLSLQPLVTSSHLCASVKAPLLSDHGILEAVANAVSAGGTSTTVGDLIDPARSGGVAVVWLFQPGGPQLRAPATDTAVQVSAGTVWSIAWAPPGLGPPGQSARGFFVVDAPVSPIGVSVVLLPAGATEAVQLTPMDPGEVAPRPWAFPALPPVHLPPGVVSFLELPAITPGALPPPDWACLP